MRYLSITGAKGQPYLIAIWESPPTGIGQSLVDGFPKGDQNKMRWAIRCLTRLNYRRGYVPDRFTIVETGERWFLYVDAYSWPNKGSFYAGMLFAKRRRKKKRKIMQR